MPKSQYGLATGEKGSPRLRELNRVCNPETLHFLSTTCSVMKGMRVLDVGCGIGLMTNELSRLVGPHGQVIAIDNSAEQLAIAKSNITTDLDNVIFIQTSVYDISATMLGRFDVIYGRFIFIHLGSPFQVIADLLMPLLNPGGVFVCEESTNVDVMFSEPPSAIFDAWKRAALQQMQHYKCDPEIGRKLYHLFMQQRCSILGVRFLQPLLTTPAAKSQLWHGIIELTDMLVATEHATLGQVQQLIADLKNFGEENNTLVGLQQYSQLAAAKPFPVTCIRLTSAAELEGQVKPLFIHTLSENVLTAGEQLSKEAALSYASQRFTDSLSHGIKTDNNFIYRIILTSSSPTIIEPADTILKDTGLQKAAASASDVSSASDTSADLVGYIWVKFFSEDRGLIARIALIYVLAEHRKNSYAYSAIKSLEPTLRREHAVTTLQARVYNHNTASMGLMGRLNFFKVPARSTDAYTVFEKSLVAAGVGGP